jgi:hypothetical protein
MKKYIIYPSICMSLLFVFSSCVSVTKQSKSGQILDASQEDNLGGTGTSSADIRSMAERMAREIASLEWPNGTFIALTTIDNQTRFPFNPNIIKDRLLTDLVMLSAGGKVRFTENIAQAQVILSARITALSRGSAAGVSDYLLYSFKLVDKDGSVIWMGAYETKKQGSTGVMYR